MKGFLNSLIEEIDKVLSPLGFIRSSDGEWERKCSWKIEQIDLRIGEIRGREFQPAFRVAVLRTNISSVGDNYFYLAEIKLPQLVDPSLRPNAHISIPRFFLQKKRVLSKTVEEVRRSMLWFQQFETPALCKKNLKKFLKPGCPAFVDTNIILDRLIKNMNN
jgi:hypothetical protein